MKDEKDLSPRTKDFARRVIRMYAAMAKNNTAAQVLGKQELRSATSIGANYREANRARSKAEFVCKIGDCLKEADEALYWLELISEESFLPARRLQTLLAESNELVAIFATIHKNSRSRP